MEAEAKAEEYLAGWKRAQADYQNLKKQMEKERGEMAMFARSSVLVQIIPILENLRRAFAHVPKDHETAHWVVGLKHIERQIADLIAQQGLKEIDAEGRQFDPAVHEAVAKEKREGAASGTILEVVGSGWMIGNDVLVPSKVKVAE